MTQELARLEDLPADYRSALSELNLVPLWPNLRGVLPPDKPRPKTVPACWSYRTLRPLLLAAGELTPIEKAERRVLVLANPGHGRENMQATAAIYLGMQLVLPGEWAPAHRHTPIAGRLIVVGESAYTTVGGEKCVMSRGDVILTPSGQWHEHGHEGDQPVVWLDVLDLPLVYYLEASYHIDGPKQEVKPERGDVVYAHGGIVPSENFERSAKPYPMLRYPWTETRAALIALAGTRPRDSSLQVTYINPESGLDAQHILGYYAQMLRPGQTVALPTRSPATIFHVIEGGIDIQIDQERYRLDEADTCCAPGYSAVRLENTSKVDAAFLFIADESPLQRKLGVFESRA